MGRVRVRRGVSRLVVPPEIWPWDMCPILTFLSPVDSATGFSIELLASTLPISRLLPVSPAPTTGCPLPAQQCSATCSSCSLEKASTSDRGSTAWSKLPARVAVESRPRQRDRSPTTATERTHTRIARRDREGVASRSRSESASDSVVARSRSRAGRRPSGEEAGSRGVAARSPRWERAGRSARLPRSAEGQSSYLDRTIRRLSHPQSD